MSYLFRSDEKFRFPSLSHFQPLPEVSANNKRMDWEWKSVGMVLSPEEGGVDTAGGAGNNKRLQLLLSKMSISQ